MSSHARYLKYKRAAVAPATSVPTRASSRLLKLLKVFLPEEPGVDGPRPKTRADCAAIERPCPYVSCRHHLYLDVKPNGTVKLNFPDLEPHELEVSCSLDVAAEGGIDLFAVSRAMNITYERARQLELQGLERARRRLPLLGIDR